MQTQGLKVLISGAGIAGPTLALLLARAGHQATVVERDQGVRSSGNPVDVRQGAYEVAERLGISGRLCDAATEVREAVFVDDRGVRIASLPTRRSKAREVEVARSDLSAILVEAGRDEAEFLFDKMITELRMDGNAVDARFDHATPRRFDLVVGADGIHSGVRRLAFGPESDFVEHLGMYVATAKLGLPVERDDIVVMHNQPGRATALHPGTGQSGVAFIFRSRIRIDQRDAAAVRRLLEQVYDADVWRTRELLSAYLQTDDVYFDSVSRIRVPTWSRGHVTLLGDAASCASLFGDGSSSAMEGAATLATALLNSPHDIPTALARYELTHRALTRRRQRGLHLASHLLVPTTRLGITLRNQTLRIIGRR